MLRLGRSRRDRLIDPGGWPPGGEGRRVLVENADGGEAWAYAEILRKAGYQVATCRGPTGENGWLRELVGESLRCPLIETGRCPLVEGADVVVSGFGVGQSDELLTALTAGEKDVVFEAPAPMFGRYLNVHRAARLLAFPVTEEALLDAVAEAAVQPLR